MTSQICLVPYMQGLGGMVSFQAKFIRGLENFNVDTTFDLADPRNDAILVIGGTRQVGKLLQAKKQGVRIVQRLNGMNWLHRVEKTPIKAWFRGETANMLLTFIRRHVCDRIIYQSAFSQWWWEDEHGRLSKPSLVTYNGIDLSEYAPQGASVPSNVQLKILLVEGHLSGHYARGLDVAADFANHLVKEYHQPTALSVAGDVPDTLKLQYHWRYPDLAIEWLGVVPQSALPAIESEAHLLFSADLNAACPNSVVEALACGLPVLAYDTGALSELVKDKAGIIVPYGGDHWRLDPPDIPALAQAALTIFHDNQAFRLAARKRAEQAFDLEVMTRSYLDFLLG